MNGVHLDIDLTTANVVVQAQVIGVSVVTEVPGATFGVPGPTGQRGPAGAPGGVITWPTGSEPSLEGVADGTLWVEFTP